jgi:hypothetical protein
MKDIGKELGKVFGMFVKAYLLAWLVVAGLDWLGVLDEVATVWLVLACVFVWWVIDQLLSI